MRLSAFDPSINRIGAATFEWPEGKLLNVQTLISPKKTETERLRFLIDALEEYLMMERPKAVAIERLGSWTRKTKEGRAKNVGSLLSLAVMTGAVFATSHYTGCLTTLIPVRDWCKFRSEDQRKSDAERLYGYKPKDIHQADAILIGHFALSEWNIEKAMEGHRQ